MQNLLPFRCHKQLLLSIIRFNSGHSETYYDILKVKHDCSIKDIRNAFVQLSKECHPDTKGVNVDPKQTEKFVKISEAYQVLSKPHLRNAYDQKIYYTFEGSKARSSRRTYGVHTTEVHRHWDVKPNYDPDPGPYYGVKGWSRISNGKVAFGLAVLCLFGAIFGFGSVKNSFTFNRQKLDEKSVEASIYHASVRANAEKYGNEEQLRRMVNRMVKTTD